MCQPGPIGRFALQERIETARAKRMAASQQAGRELWLVKAKRLQANGTVKHFFCVLRVADFYNSKTI